MKARILLLPAVAGLLGCTNEASHVPNVLLLPGYAVSTAIENAAYYRKRDQVEVFVKNNHPSLINEILTGGGPLLQEAMKIARVPMSEREALLLELQENKNLYAENAEAMVVTLMVHGI
ncbi:hypothetical protein [Parasulfitobacter algicola]|uniref:Lipoprotein n=1 Tax=Parasulfitobacter algicola TaxID=2614809 RepID=A0ABX2IXN3_9RHOB|nr:hypothetical protein [Sulfitobacter algicola]NSX55269.1 hypothetical protein [Sulfitobacter algicola]